MQHTGKAYDRLSSLYDALSHLYSGGKIRALKTAQRAQMRAGDKILYAGVGTGEEAASMARSNVEVTILDTSPHHTVQSERVLAGLCRDHYGRKAVRAAIEKRADQADVYRRRWSAPAVAKQWAIP
jgi:2-polyprenyl-3-methyl-5-hydroxy-6-metoxy-1,4-benzoquinol methylase